MLSKESYLKFCTFSARHKIMPLEPFILLYNITIFKSIIFKVFFAITGRL